MTESSPVLFSFSLRDEGAAVFFRPFLRRAARGGRNGGQSRAAVKGALGDVAVLRQAQLRKIRAVGKGARPDGADGVGDVGRRDGAVPLQRQLRRFSSDSAAG